VADPSGAVVTDQQISQGAGATPVTLTVQGNEQLLPKLAFAAYDGTAAAGNFLPVVRFIGPGGQIAGQAVGDVVTAGASVDQTWFRGLAQQGTTGGGVTTVTEYVSAGLGMNIPGDGTNHTYTPWIHSGGAALLDYTNPSAPTVISAGTYSVGITSAMVTAVFNKPSVMATFLQVGIFASRLKGVCPLATNVSASLLGVDSPEVVLTMPPLDLAAGDAIAASVAQGSGGALDFSIYGMVSLIS
jgi:hypothetical protein